MTREGKDFVLDVLFKNFNCLGLGLKTTSNIVYSILNDIMIYIDNYIGESFDVNDVIDVLGIVLVDRLCITK